MGSEKGERVEDFWWNERVKGEGEEGNSRTEVKEGERLWRGNLVEEG